MVANTTPIFTLKPDLSVNNGTGQGTVLTAAANDIDGTGVNNQLVFTAGSPDAAYLRKLRFKALGTNVQTVARIFLNNGSSPTVAANNKWLDDLQLPATTLSTTAPTGAVQEYVAEFGVSAGWRVYVGLATAVAGGYSVTPIAGQYA